MSLLWSGGRDGRSIEVRGAGRTRRLVVDGVLHSSWSPVRPLTGAVWDHLALPTFAVAPDGARDVLLLGVGGGAALRLLADLAPPDRMVGVELDEELLEVARTWFGLDATGAEIVHADARQWLRANARTRFDLVIDDLFTESDGEPVRPADLSGPWWRRLAKHVRPGGALVVNFTWRAELESSDLCQDLRFRERFPMAFSFDDPQYENAVAVFLTQPLTLAMFRARLRAHPVLGRATARRLMRFRLRTLWPR